MCALMPTFQKMERLAKSKINKIRKYYTEGVRNGTSMAEAMATSSLCP